MRRPGWKALRLCSVLVYVGFLVHAGGLAFTESPQNSTASVGGELKLFCKAHSASLGPAVVWLRDGKPLQDAGAGSAGGGGGGEHHSVAEFAVSNNGGAGFLHQSMLSIHDVQHGDAGSYACEVTLPGGVVVRSTEAWIQVEGRPTITEEPRSCNVTSGEPFSLRCTALGPPEPVWIKWFSSADVQPQESDNGRSPSELHVSGITQSTSFTCHAENSRGTSVSKVARVNVRVLPEAPSSPQVLTVSTHDARLSWNTGFDGFSPLLGCRVQAVRNDGQWADAANDTDGGDWAPDDDTGVQEDVAAGDPGEPLHGATLSGLEPGTDYRARVACHNGVGMSSWSVWVRVQTNGHTATLPEFLPWLLGVAAALAVIGAVVVAVLWRRRKQAFRLEIGTGDLGEPLVDVSAVRSYRRDNSEPTLEPWGLSEALSRKMSGVLLKRPCLVLGNVLGEGEFGCVLEGRLKKDNGTEVQVAVKTMKVEVCTSSDIESFLNEVLAMKDFDHPNVIRLLGVCLDVCPDQRLPRPMALLPFMRHGDLHSFLKATRVTCSPVYMPLQTLLRFMVDISRGMEYLSANNFVHRDLAARNCMLHEDMSVCVADFGLAKKIYSGDYYRQGQISRMPVKWLAPECMTDRLYTSKSDVWAFGVTMWEIVMRGQAPYPGIANHEMFEYLSTGKRLKQPPDCLDELFAIMSDCWRPEAAARPAFPALYQRLEALLAGLPLLTRREDALYGNVPTGSDAPRLDGGGGDGDGGGDGGGGDSGDDGGDGGDGGGCGQDGREGVAAAVNEVNNDYVDAPPVAVASLPPPKPVRLNDRAGPPAPVAKAEWLTAQTAEAPKPPPSAAVMAPELARGPPEGGSTAASSEPGTLLEETSMETTEAEEP